MQINIFRLNNQTGDIMFIDIFRTGQALSALGADRVIDYTQNGIYLMASFKLRRVFTMLRTSITGEKPDDLHEIKALIETGNKQGFVVITIA
jgi:hypothetical protein